MRARDKLVLFISLLGVILSFHLWIQKQRGFDRGCWGLSSMPGIAGGCNEEALQQYSTLLGFSTIIWSFAFFFTMAATCFVALTQGGLAAVWAKAMRLLLLSTAIPYCGFLVYFQFHVADALCPLCLSLSGLIFVTGGIYLYGIVFHRRCTSINQPTLADVGAANGIIVGTLLCGVAFFLFSGQFNLSTPALRPTQPRAVTQITFLEAEWTEGTSFSGSSVQGPTMIAFFDPNCPHCGKTFDDVSRLAKKFAGRVNVHVVPRILWAYSILQVQAIEIARVEGKYQEMWQLQFDLSRKGGMDEDFVVGLFAQMGLNLPDIKNRLKKVKPDVLKKRQLARDAGIYTTPVIFINGSAIPGTDRHFEALSLLLERTLTLGQKPLVERTLN